VHPLTYLAGAVVLMKSSVALEVQIEGKVDFSWVRFPILLPDSNQALHLAGLFYYPHRNNGGICYVPIHQTIAVLSSIRL